MRRVIAMVLASATIVVQARGQHSGLLLGIGGYEPRTVWVEVSGDTVRVRSGAGIIVPRKSGFWRVGLGRPPASYPELRDSVMKLERADSAAAGAGPVAGETDTNPDSASDPAETNMMGEPIGHEICFAAGAWAAPLGRWPSISYPECGENDDAGGEVYYTFVGAEHVSGWLEQAGEYTYQYGRGSFLGSLDRLAAHGITDVGDSVGGAPVPANQALYARELRRCGREWMSGMHQSEPEPGEPEYVYDHRGVAIVRGAGKWQYVALFAITSGAGRGSDSHCTMQVPIANVVTGGGRLAVPLAQIRKRVPDAIDALSSPDGRTLIVLSKREVAAFRLDGPSIGRELGAASWESIMSRYATGYEEPGRTIVTQWAGGRGAERWSRELASVLPDVAPVRRGGVRSAPKDKR